MTFVRFMTIASGMCVLAACAVALSQEIGDTVRCLQGVSLKVEDEVVATVAKGDLLTVRKTSDKWLWVQTADGRRGWVLKSHVEAAPAGAAPPATPGTATVQPKSGEDPWLRSIGVLSGQNIYTTYAYIGAVADGYGDSTYDAEHVRQLMAEVVGMTKVSRDSLEQVRSTNIVEQDKAAIGEVISILDLLSREAEALSRYAESNAEQDLKSYDEARKSVWPKVKNMLDLK